MKNETRATGYIFNIFNKSLLALAALLFTVPAFYAQSFQVEIPWAEPASAVVNGETVTYPVIAENDYSEGAPHFSYQKRIKNGRYQLTYSNVSTVIAPALDVQFLTKNAVVIPTTAKIELLTRKSATDHFLIASVFPYINVNGSIHRITGFSVQASFLGNATAGKEKDYVANSVLNEGDWYKISVAKDGVFKIDRAFLASCGIDVETLDPNKINIYGNASGRLSEKNSDFFFDDLTKNAITVIGGNDGVFDEGDYILFYGKGPHRWDYNASTGFERNQHIYSDVNCYFIHVSDSDVPLRMTEATQSNGTTTHNVTSYDYRDIHENERYSLVKGGQRWYGELFDGELTQAITFSVPDIVGGAPVRVQYAVASNATDSNCNFKFYLGGNLLHTHTLSAGNFARNENAFNFNASTGALSFSLTLTRTNPAIKGYLDYIEITTRRNLKVTGDQFLFRDLVSVGTGNVSQFSIAGMSAQMNVWEVTDPRHPGSVNGTLSGSQYSFKYATDSLREFIVFNGSTPTAPVFVEAIQNQDLHALGAVDYLIVTHPNFTGQAERLASLHIQNGTSTIVVTTKQIYNEFSSGVQDATAIRRFVKMFYDRANGDVNLRPKYLLLFGDVTYDPKNRIGNNNYMVPSYEVLNSEDIIRSAVTDDYFALLDDNESNQDADLLDIGVGRLLITTSDHAVEQVNKIEHYMHNGSTLFSGGPNDCCTGDNNSLFGDWRLNYALITDDEQNGYFVNTDAEPIAAYIAQNFPEMNCDKIYSDAYVQTSTAGGQRYPDVFNAISERVDRGGLMINYIGHGGEVGAADERFITIPQIQSWTNINKLSLFVTATCEFTKFDDPSRVSAGEWLSLNPTGGAIALMTTSRSVYVSLNTAVIRRFYEHVFERETDFRPKTFGEIITLTKNAVGASDNKRSFNLIGDPALRLALPMWKVVTDSINHHDPDLTQDTIRALSKMNVKGHLEDYSGNVLTTYNGVLSPTIFDKPKTTQTLSNDGVPLSPIIDFKVQKNALYKGKATVANGYFSFDCVIPKDIDYNFGKGKISYYFNNTTIDADGLDTNFIVGGIDLNAAADTQGPTIEIFLNDNQFVNGGITSQQPVLIVDCYDDNGINTAGNGVGHDLVAILDGNTGNPIVLNNYYTGKLDSYQAGQIQYTLRDLSIGAHTLDVKIWDVNNNSSVARVEFTVVEDQEVKLDHVLNYPNPFTTKTTFYFEHNQSCSSLQTQVQIYTVSGRLIRTINKQVATTGFRAEGIDWDGRDDFGDQLAKGVYVYRLSVELPEGGKADKMEKLVLLR